MIGQRETIYGALFDLLATTPGFARYSRKWLNFEQLSTAQMPTLMMRQKSESVTADHGIPAVYHSIVELCLIVSTPSSSDDSTPAAIINPLIDAVEAQLSPFNQMTADRITGTLTLGNQNISRIWIEGTIDIYEAITNDVSFVYLPVNIITV